MEKNKLYYYDLKEKKIKSIDKTIAQRIWQNIYNLIKNIWKN